MYTRERFLLIFVEWYRELAFSYKLSFLVGKKDLGDKNKDKRIPVRSVKTSNKRKYVYK